MRANSLVEACLLLAPREEAKPFGRNPLRARHLIDFFLQLCAELLAMNHQERLPRSDMFERRHDGPGKRLPLPWVPVRTLARANVHSKNAQIAVRLIG